MSLVLITNGASNTTFLVIPRSPWIIRTFDSYDHLPSIKLSVATIEEIKQLRKNFAPSIKGQDPFYLDQPLIHNFPELFL